MDKSNFFLLFHAGIYKKDTNIAAVIITSLRLQSAMRVVQALYS